MRAFYDNHKCGCSVKGRSTVMPGDCEVAVPENFLKDLNT